jgi:hypothetical protein
MLVWQTMVGMESQNRAKVRSVGVSAALPAPRSARDKEHGMEDHDASDRDARRAASDAAAAAQRAENDAEAARKRAEADAADAAARAARERAHAARSTPSQH